MKIDFENFLMEKHAEQYIGTKDCMIDDFNKWVCELGADELIEYGNQALLECKLALLKNCTEKKIQHILLTNNPIGTTAEGVEINMELARVIVKIWYR